MRQIFLPPHAGDHTSPNADREDERLRADAERPHDGRRCGIDARDRAVAEIRDPDEAVRRDRAVDRLGADAHRRGHRAGHRVDPRHGSVQDVRDPEHAPAVAREPDRVRMADRHASHGVRGGVDPVDAVAPGRADPDRACSEGQSAWPVRNRDRRGNAIRGRVHARDGVVGVVRHPDRFGGEEDVIGAEADADALDLAGVGIDPGESIRAVGVRPDAACAGHDPTRLGIDLDRLPQDAVPLRVDDADRVAGEVGHPEASVRLDGGAGMRADADLGDDLRSGGLRAGDAAEG